MLEFEQIRYVNHLNEPLYFGENNMYVNLNSLHDFHWDVISKNDKISGFEKKIQKKTFPVRIAALSEEEGYQKRNELFEIPEKDVLAGIPGRLIINGYYLSCFITDSGKSYYSTDGKFLSCDITVTTDNAFWIRERTPEISGEYFTNPNSFDSNFRIVISGAVSNPEIVIRGHVYQVYVNVPSGKSLVIDSIEEVAYITDSLAEEMLSVFGDRNRESYIFEKIPAGRSGFATTANLNYSIVLYDERSEPKWAPYDEGSDAENWIYELIDQHVFETTYVYVKPSGLNLYIDSNGHLIQEKATDSKINNYFELENGRLMAYHD